MSPGSAWLSSRANPLSKVHPEGDLFPLRVFVCNILATAIAYVIERSKVA